MIENVFKICAQVGCNFIIFLNVPVYAINLIIKLNQHVLSVTLILSHWNFANTFQIALFFIIWSYTKFITCELNKA